MIHITTLDQKIITVDKNLLLPFDYFSDLFEYEDEIIDLPFNHLNISNFLEYLNKETIMGLTTKDAKLADFLRIDHYLLFVFKRLIKDGMDKKIFKLLCRYNYLHYFVNDVINYMEAFTLADSNNYDPEFDSKQIFQKMTSKHLDIFIKKFPLRKSNTLIYLELLKIGYDKLKKSMIHKISNKLAKYDYDTLVTFIQKLEDTQLKTVLQYKEKTIKFKTNLHKLESMARNKRRW